MYVCVCLFVGGCVCMRVCVSVWLCVRVCVRVCMCVDNMNSYYINYIVNYIAGVVDRNPRASHHGKMNYILVTFTTC